MAPISRRALLGSAAVGAGSVLQPWHLNTQTTDAQQVEDLGHSWSGTHGAFAGRLHLQ